MKLYKAEIFIEVSPERVWKVLVDAAAYPEWDPGMVRVEGEIAPGAKVTFFTKISPDRSFPVKVTVFEPGQRLVLIGGMPLGMFNSERMHTLRAKSGGGTYFATQETFGGWLMPVFGRNIPDLTATFEQFAAALKARSEAS